jgi:hypothetical protein
MRLHLFAAMLATVCLVNGEDAGQDKAALLREFTPAEAKVLEKPFEGSIRVVWPKDETGAEPKPESVRLNLMRPADGHKGHSPIDTPYLATSENGSSYWGAFALRPTLPETGKLTSFSSYKEIIDLLGAPTHLPIGGETDDKWAYDMVSWRLFMPSDLDSLDVVEVNVFRKSSLGDARDEKKYVIDSYLVSRGTLTRGGKAGAPQHAGAVVQPGLGREVLVERASRAIRRIEAAHKTLVEVRGETPRPNNHAQQVEEYRKASAEARQEIDNLTAVIKKGEPVLSYPGLIGLGRVRYVPSTDTEKELRNIYCLEMVIGYSDTAGGGSEGRVYEVRFDRGGVIVAHGIRPRMTE